MARRTWGSLVGVSVFWWVVFWILQTTNRLFLVRDAAQLEWPRPGILGLTLLTGARADLIVATLLVVLAVLVAPVLTLPLALAQGRRARAQAAALLPSTLTVACWALAAVCAMVVTVDMAYYAHNRQHLDAVFFEYVEEMVAREPTGAGAAEIGTGSRQALAQTRAEVGDIGKWLVRLAAFAGLQAGVLFGWRWLFRRRLQPRLARWAAAQPRASAAVLGVALLAGATGLQPEGPLAIARVSIASTTYYGLAQNPIWQTADAWLLAFGPEEHGTVARARQIMPLEEAIALTRQVVAPAADFASDRYPLVRRTTRPAGARHPRPDNVLLLFVEGLDRRYVGPRLTPFLDRWGREAVVFENFFANGELTHHGLFTTLCSHLSGLGKSPIKARYTNDFLCLPALLQRAGYWTEMVIGYNRDHHQDHTALFLARNGIRQFLDEGNFDAGRERMGLGVTDGALLDELRERIRALRQGAQPFFLTALTVSTHHPFVVPARDPAVATLLREPDRYPATLRYVDGELARFFTELERDGSLDDTVVVLLGDHGRHEVIGETDYERWLGRHLTPLFVWMPPALRAATGLRPRRVSAVASQVDVTPTLLGLLGLTPPLTPFTGQDLSGLLVGDRHVDGEAVLLTSHSAALADARGILVYGLNSEQVRGSDLALRDVRELPAASPDVADRVRRLKALVVASTILVAENRVWSWAQFGRTLASPTVAEPIRGRPR